MIYSLRKIEHGNLTGFARRTLAVVAVAVGLTAGMVGTLFADCGVPCSCAAVAIPPYGTTISDECSIDGEPTQCTMESVTTSGQTQCELAASGTDCLSTLNLAYAYTVTTTYEVGCAENLVTQTYFCSTQPTAPQGIQYGVPNYYTGPCN